MYIHDLKSNYFMLVLTSSIFNLLCTWELNATVYQLRYLTIIDN